MLATTLQKEMIKLGIEIENNFIPTTIEKDEKAEMVDVKYGSRKNNNNKEDSCLTSTLKLSGIKISPDGKEEVVSFEKFDKIIIATGREPLTHGLNLSNHNIKTSFKTGHILVNEKQETSCDGIYALGDVCGE